MSLRVVHALLVRLVIFIVNTKMRIFFTFKLGWVIITYCYKNNYVCCVLFQKTAIQRCFDL